MQIFTRKWCLQLILNIFKLDASARWILKKKSFSCIPTEINGSSAFHWKGWKTDPALTANGSKWPPLSIISWKMSPFYRSVWLYAHDAFKLFTCTLSCSSKRINTELLWRSDLKKRRKMGTYYPARSCECWTWRLSGSRGIQTPPWWTDSVLLLYLRALHVADVWRNRSSEQFVR